MKPNEEIITRDNSDGLSKVYIVKAGGNASSGYINLPIKLVLPKKYIGKRVIIQLKEIEVIKNGTKKRRKRV